MFGILEADVWGINRRKCSSYSRILGRKGRTLGNGGAVDLSDLFWFWIYLEGGTYEMCCCGIQEKERKQRQKRESAMSSRVSRVQFVEKRNAEGETG